MKDLLYKEFRLAKHPTMFFFPLFALMLLIPSYPYYIAFIYTGLEVFFIFQNGMLNKDTLFTVMLPVRKTDVVRARCLMIAIIELFQVLLSVPMAVLRANLNIPANGAGIEANVAFFGLVLVMFALYNILFIPTFYKTACTPGRALILAGISMFVFIAAAESCAFLFPAIDTVEKSAQIRQIPILLAGMAIYAVSMLASCRMGAKRFEAVDL